MGAENSSVGSETTNVAAARRALMEVLRAWIDLAPQLEVASEDALHRARVMTRRTRAILWLIRPVLSRPVDEGALRSLTRALGVLRDADVLAALARSFDLSLAPPPPDSLDQAREILTREVADGAAFEQVALAVADLPVDREAISTIGRRFEREWRRVSRRAKAVKQNAPDRALHRLRIRIKRVRYAASALEASPEAIERFQSALAAIQDRLGAYHDCGVLASLVDPTLRLTKALAKAKRRAIESVAAWPHSEAKRLLRELRP